MFAVTPFGYTLAEKVAWVVAVLLLAGFGLLVAWLRMRLER